MTKNPSKKLSKVFDLILLLVIRIHVCNWEVVVVCHSRTPGKMRIILTQVIQLHSSSTEEWGQVRVIGTWNLGYK